MRAILFPLLRLRTLLQRCAWLACGLGALLVAHAADAPVADPELGALGPLAHEFRLTFEKGTRAEAAGPIFAVEDSESQYRMSFTPIWSASRSREIDSRVVYILPPLMSYFRYGEEWRAHLFQLFALSGGQTPAETNRHRTTVFPFFFRQTSPIPEENYTAVLPFYGRLQNRLFRDEVKFIMLPLYVQSRKRDVVTDNYVWPLFHLRQGDGLRGWQFWPLYGTETKIPTTRTNHWGDEELVAGHEKRFVLWPFWLEQTTGTGTTNESHLLTVPPLFLSQRGELRDSFQAPWPVGVNFTRDREKDYLMWGAPWPFVVFSEGSVTTRRVWPLFSLTRSATKESDYYLWPIYHRSALHAAPLERKRTQIAFFLWSDLEDLNTETGRTRVRQDAWPWFTHRRDFEGNERWQVLALLEPMVPENKAISWTYAPLWSLWRAEKSATGRESQSLLWNLYRHDDAITNRSSSLLFGLVQWRVTPEGRRARWLHLPFETRY